MTVEDRIHIMRCALCKKPFSYIWSADDYCRPDTPNIICDKCYKDHSKPDPYDDWDGEEPAVGLKI